VFDNFINLPKEIQNLVIVFDLCNNIITDEGTRGLINLTSIFYNDRIITDRVIK